MKKIFLIAACFVLAACEAPVQTFMSEFHGAAAAACEKNGGYEKLRIWERNVGNPNYHIVIVCNDKAEIFIMKIATAVDGEWVWGEWQSDDKRFGKWQ